VSHDHRNQGLGRLLFEQAVERARAMGASRLYISATPSENTVDVYLHLGCVVANELDDELFELELEDIHMAYRQGGAMIGDDEGKAVTIVRWIARVAAGLASAMILLFLVGNTLSEGLAPLLHMSLRESALMAAFGVVWLGLMLGWRWEILGGSLTIGGMVAFYLLDCAFSGTLPRGPYFLMLASPGLLFLYVGLRAGEKPAGQPGE